MMKISRHLLSAPSGKAKVALLLYVLGCCFKLAYAEAAGKSSHYKTVSFSIQQLAGEATAATLDKIISANKELTWTVYLPDLITDEAPGVLVYISPTPSAELDQNWVTALNQHNMIYIAAHDSGNKTLVNKRMIMALMALNVVEKITDYDKSKVFISGFSGGGRVASKLAAQYPAIFKGALYICGVDKWSKKQKSKLAQIKQNRFVFLTGSRDFNRKETRMVYRYYQRFGVEQSKLLTVQGMSHEHPDALHFNQALEFLSKGL